MKREHSAGVIVYYDTFIDDKKKREFLILNYRKGHWDLPKGKLEKDETNLQAAIRELKEETNLEAEILPDFEHSLSYIFKDMDGILTKKDVDFFVGRAKTKDVTLSHEHLDYKWAIFKDAVRELTFPNAQQILTMANQFLSSHIDRN